MSRKVKEQKQSKIKNSNNQLKNIKSNLILKKFFSYIHKRRTFEAIKYNKSIQKRINININDYKNCSEIYSSIEIEIIPKKKKYEYDSFIIIEEEEEEYYHIFYNDNKGEKIEKNYLNEDEKVSKINIIIDYHVDSFSNLFYGCKCIESIYFKKFYRNNITNMTNMFYECSSLKELNLNNFITNNVTDMTNMFFGCSSLKELNLNNFNTNNVSKMNQMFYGCSSLKELNLNNFNTSNVTNMSQMFYGCSSLKELNINNFNTNNVFDMRYMFSGCSDELKFKIKSKFHNFTILAFENKKFKKKYKI